MGTKEKRTIQNKETETDIIFNDIPLLNSDTYTNIHTPQTAIPQTHTYHTDPNSHVDPNTYTYTHIYIYHCKK